MAFTLTSLGQLLTRRRFSRRGTNRRRRLPEGNRTETLTPWRHLVATVVVAIFADMQWLPSAAAAAVTAFGGVAVHGAGASFPAEVYQAWIPSYIATRSEHVQLDMWYQAVGSGSGKRRMRGELDPGEEPIHYAGSDSLLTATAYEAFPDLRMFPTMAGAVVMGYNLPGLFADERGGGGGDNRLVLSMRVLVKIYNGEITFWNDSRLQDLNPTATLPGNPIMVLARADNSGTTSIFTEALDGDPDWRAGVFNAGGPDAGKWPPGVITYYGHQNRGMAGLILSFPYTLGYMSIADANEVAVTHSNLLSPDGALVQPNMTSVQEAMNLAASDMETRLTVSLSHYASSKSYPIAAFTYMVVHLETMPDCDTAVELVRYVDWFLSSQSAMRTCVDKGMTPLSNAVVDKIRTQILQKMLCGGESLWMAAQKRIASEEADNDISTLAIGIATSVVVAFGLSILTFLVVRWTRKLIRLSKDEWKINVEDVIFYWQASPSRSQSDTSVTSWPSVDTLTEVSHIERGGELLNQVLHWPGRWNQRTIGLRLLELELQEPLARNTKAFLLKLRNFSHNNILTLHGLTPIDTRLYLVNDFCSKGCLMDLVRDSKLNLNNDLRYALSLDVASGLSFLHSKAIVHGQLRSMCCLLDFKWGVKIADWEFYELYRFLDKRKNPLLHLAKTADMVGDTEAAYLNFWVAPELLKSDYAIRPTPASDIYSYGIILQEIFTREKPFAEHMESMATTEILKAVINNNLRPVNRDWIPTTVRDIMEAAWREDPRRRPRGEDVVKQLHAAHNFKRTVIDTMIEAMEEYATSLESRLDAARTELATSRTMVDTFLAKTMPGNLLTALTPCDADDAGVPTTVAASVLPVRGGDGGLSPATISENVAALPAMLHRPYECWATVVSLCFPKTIRDSELWTMHNNLDLLLDNILQDYPNAHRVDNATGSVLVLFVTNTDISDDVISNGANSQQPQRRTVAHAQNDTHVSCAFRSAASFVFRLRHADQELRPDDGNSKGVLQIGIHSGMVKFILVSNSIPRCLLIGQVITESQLLSTSCPVGGVHVSREYGGQLTNLATDKYELLPSGVQEKAPSHATTKWQTFWLQERPKQSRARLIVDKGMPVIV